MNGAPVYLAYDHGGGEERLQMGWLQDHMNRLVYSYTSNISDAAIKELIGTHSGGRIKKRN